MLWHIHILCDGESHYLCSNKKKYWLEMKPNQHFKKKQENKMYYYYIIIIILLHFL